MIVVDYHPGNSKPFTTQANSMKMLPPSAIHKPVIADVSPGIFLGIAKHLRYNDFLTFRLRLIWTSDHTPGHWHISASMDTPDKKSTLLINLGIYASALFAGIIVVSIVGHTEIGLIIRDLWDLRIEPDKNSIKLLSHAQISPLIVQYLGLLFSFIIVLILQQVRPDMQRQRSLGLSFRPQVFLFLTFFIASQSISHIRYSISQVRTYHNKTTAEKISHNYQKSYEFAEYCKRYLPGKHACRLVTDLDTSPQGNLITYLAIRYYLYPLDIVTQHADGAEDCVVVVLKDNPAMHVPSSYSAQPAYDAKSLIAIKDPVKP